MRTEENSMKISLSIGSAYYDGANWEGMVELVRAADRIGVDFAWTAEAWGMETIAPLAYLAPLTERIRLGTGIMQINARTPATTAMTALTMARLTNDRFCLGLGVSGPQVVEGLHGASFDKPLARLREYVAVVRKAIAGERVTSDGPHYQLPRPGGEGKALRLSMPPKPDIPIYLATLGPKMLELTGEVADGWLGTSFMADAADQVIPHLRAGAQRAGRTLADLDLQINATVEVSDDVDALIAKYRPGAAFTLGAMGSAKTNFYNAAYSRAGWGEMAKKVQSLWVSGDKPAAIAAVADEFVLAALFIGTDAMVTERIRATAATGINTLRLSPVGHESKEQIDNLERTVAAIHAASSPT
jgi:F420-dependent oxidoreductase-like protein